MSLFDENTYKRLNVIKLINPSFSDSLLNHLMTLPTVLFKKQTFTISKEKAPLTALKDSKFSRYKSILLAVNTLTTKYTLDLNPHKVIIYSTSLEDNVISENYINHVGNIIRWWCSVTKNMGTNRKYQITLYLTTIKKRLPPPNQPKVLTEEYSNSGFTFVAEPREIHIFRKEESLKVLIHELIHSCEFDFNNNHLSKLPLVIKDENLTNEGITEYLAVIYYYWYVASFANYSKFPNIKISDLFLEYLGNDLGWQEYQINKILLYFNMKPTDLLIKNNFRQQTSIVSYFFLKNYLFNEDSLPIILSRNYNDINTLVNNMKDYIIDYKTDTVPHNSLSMRMSLYELL
jgi:hypothetical protein